MEQAKKAHIKPGDEVGWQWVNGLAIGTVVSVHPKRTEIISKGSRIVRNGTKDNPAVIIAHESGNPVLKLQSEIQPLSK